MKYKIKLQERDRDIIAMGIIAVISLITTAIMYKGINVAW